MIVLVYELSGCGFRVPLQSLKTSDFAPVSTKELLTWHSGNYIKCEFTLKRVHDMTITSSQMDRADKYSQHSSIIFGHFG